MATRIAVIDDVCIVVAPRRRHDLHHRLPAHGYGLLLHRVEGTIDVSVDDDEPPIIVAILDGDLDVFCGTRVRANPARGVRHESARMQWRYRA